MNNQLIRILLVDPNDDTFGFFQKCIIGWNNSHYAVDQAKDYETALKKAVKGLHELYVFNYHLGEFTGLQLLEELKSKEWHRPVILLIQNKNTAIQALELGAVDILREDRLEPDILEQALELATERFKTIHSLTNSRKQIHILSSKLIQAQEKERKDLARELHDGIGSGLATIKYGLEKILQDQKDRSSDKDHDIQELISVIKTTIEETQELHTKLRPPILDELGLMMTIRWMCRRFKAIHTEIQIESHIQLQEDQVPEQLKIVIYRVLQEVLNNIGKHSQAEMVRIVFQKENQSIHLTIHDNGRGFEVDPECMGEMCEYGMGLDNMRERVERSGGKFHIESVIHKGTFIRAIWKNQEMDSNSVRIQHG